MFQPNTKLLIADDMLMIRKIVERSCKELGFKDIIQVTNGKEAWEALNAAGDVGLVISDWNMPEMTGIEFLKKVRSDTKFGKLPFILLTAESEKHQIAEAAAAGVDTYILKPFSTSVLRDKLEAVHKKRSAA